MNQINYHLIDEEEKQAIELEFKTKQQIIMCPFVIVDGVDEITQGTYTEDPESFKSGSFEQVFQGRNPVIALWKNSTKSVNQKTEGGLSDFNKPAIKEFTRGEYYPVILETDGETYFQSFEDDVMGNKRFTTSGNISIKVQAELDRSYWYHWYLLPELGEEFYYIQTINVFRDAKEEFAYTEISFKKVNDELKMVTTNANTLILKSSPGEEYAWPKIVEATDERQTWKDVELDTEKLQPVGIKYLQLSSLEPMLLGAFYAWGRRIENLEDGTPLITESRQLLPSKMLPAIPDPIIGINSPSDKFYWIEQGRVTVGKEYASWFSRVKENVMSFFGYNDNNQLKNYGAVKINDIETAVTSAPNKDKIDAGGNNISVPQTYWDDWVIENKAEIEYDGRVGYKTFAPYSEERIENTKELLSDKLARNVFILSNIVQLPMEYEAKVPYGIVNTTIGGIRKLILGKDVKYLTNNSNRDGKVDIPLVGEHSYIDFISSGLMTGGTEVDAKKYMPLQLFSGDRPEVVTGKNVNTFNIKIELSDEVLIDGINKITTKELGVNDENYFNTKTKVQRNIESYLIDRIIIQGIAMGDVKVTAFDSLNQPLGSIQVNTNSKRTGSLLDWTTVIKTSEWESDETEDITPNVPYPSNAGPDDTIIDDFELKETFEGVREISESWVGEVNWFEKFKEVNLDYEGTLVDFLNTHTISFGIQSTSETTTKISGIQGSPTTQTPIDETLVRSVESNVVNYDSIDILSKPLPSIKFSKISDTWYLAGKSSYTGSSQTWNARDKLTTTTSVNYMELNLEDSVMSFGSSTKFTPEYSTYSDSGGLWWREKIKFDHTEDRFTKQYLNNETTYAGYLVDLEVVDAKTDRRISKHESTTSRIKFTNVKITKV